MRQVVRFNLIPSHRVNFVVVRCASFRSTYSLRRSAAGVVCSLEGVILRNVVQLTNGTKGERSLMSSSNVATVRSTVCDAHTDSVGSCFLLPLGSSAGQAPGRVTRWS